MSEVLDLRGASKTDAEWEAAVQQVLELPDLGRVDLRGARIDAEHLAALLAAVPSGCVVAREVDTCRGSGELDRPLRDRADRGRSELWAFVAPVWVRWATDLAELADRLGDGPLAADLEDDADEWDASDREAMAALRFDRFRADRLPRLVTAAQKVPAMATWLRDAQDRVDRVCAAIAGSGGDELPAAVAVWADLVPPLAGAICCWRGDGADAPVWDRDAAEQIRRLAST